MNTKGHRAWKTHFAALIILVSVTFPASAQRVADSINVYEIADKAYKKLATEHRIDGHIIVVDFSKPSDKERLIVYDPSTGKEVFKSLVAHGKNTGSRFAKDFSNSVNSNQSSLGFYRISEKYTGKYGLSYRLDGLDPTFNDNARKRAIVIHPAWYVSQAMIAKYGRLGRSFGCPALSQKDFEKFTEIVKPGSLLFVYYPDEKYFRESAVIKRLEGSTHLLSSLEL